MTSLNKVNAAKIDAMIARVSDHALTLESAANKKRVHETVAKMRDTKVQAMLIAQNVSVAELTDFYAVQRVVRFFHDITRDVFNVAKCDENFIVTVKTLINAQDADSDVSKRDIENALMFASTDVRAHVYQRKTKIDSARQVQMCLAALKVANMQDRATNKARDCEALKLAKEKLAQVAI